MKKLDEMTITERFVLAENESTSVDTLAELSKDESGYVREACACNPSASIDTLAKLAKDEDWYVREAAARAM